MDIYESIVVPGPRVIFPSESSRQRKKSPATQRRGRAKTHSRSTAAAARASSSSSSSSSATAAAAKESVLSETVAHVRRQTSRHEERKTKAGVQHFVCCACQHKGLVVDLTKSYLTWLTRTVGVDPLRLRIFRVWPTLCHRAVKNTLRCAACAGWPEAREYQSRQEFDASDMHAEMLQLYFGIDAEAIESLPPQLK